MEPLQNQNDLMEQIRQRELEGIKRSWTSRNAASANAAPSSATVPTEQAEMPQPEAEEMGVGGYVWDALSAVPKGVVGAARDVVSLPYLAVQGGASQVGYDLADIPDYFGIFEPPKTMVGSFVDTLSGFVLGYGAVAKGLGVLGRATTLGVRTSRAARAAEVAAVQRFGAAGGRAAAAGRAFIDTSVKSAITSGLVFDGNEARLSNLLREEAGFTDPITEYLAASDDDSEMEGRLKNMIEDFLMGGVAEIGIQTVKSSARLATNQLRVHRAGVKAKLSGLNPDEAVLREMGRISQEQAVSISRAMNTTLDESETVLQMIDATGAPRENFVFMTRTETEDLLRSRGVNPDELAKEAAGFATMGNAGKIMIGAFQGADLDTAIHEVAHGVRMLVVDPAVASKILMKGDIDILAKVSGATRNADGTVSWSPEAEENFVDLFTEYLALGVAADKTTRRTFSKLTGWVREMYAINKVQLDARMAPEVRQAFNNLMNNGVDQALNVPGRIADREAILMQARQARRFDAKAALPADAGELKNLLDEEEWASIRSMPTLNRMVDLYRQFDKELLPVFRAAAESGAAVQGGYAAGSEIMERLVGRTAKELFAMFSAATSPQTKVVLHTRLGVGIAADVVTRIKSGNLADFTFEEMVAIVKDTQARVNAPGMFEDNARRAAAVANDLLARLRAAQEANPSASVPDLFDQIDTTGLYRNMTGTNMEKGAGKVPGFAEASAGRLSKVVLDTYMARILPDDMFPGLAEEALLNAKKNWLANPANYTAMSAIVRKLAEDMKILPGQVQERVWGSIYVIAALKRLGAPDDKIFKNLANEDMIASWDLLTILKSPEVTNELRRLGATEESLADIDSVAATVQNRVRTLKDQPIQVSDPGAFEKLAGRVPKAGASAGTEVIAARKARGAKLLLQSREARTAGLTPATLGDFAPGNIPGLISKKNWAVITAENPGNVPASAADNAAATSKLEADLKAQGIEYKRVTGKYGGPTENSFIIIADDDKALELGRKYDQQAVLTREGFVYQDGSVNPAKSVNVLSDDTADYYSEVDGTKFQVDIDFDRKVQRGQILTQARDTRVNKAFSDIAAQQRGEPEQAMLRVQAATGGGVLNTVVEHGGDIVNRIAKGIAEFDSPNLLDEPRKKLRRILDLLDQPYGFEKEMMEQLTEYAGSRGRSVAEVRAEVDARLREFADAHRKLPNANLPITLANRANIAVGEGRFADATRDFRKLLDLMTKEPERFEAEAKKITDPEILTKAAQEALPSTTTANFRNWFKNSVVRDPEGKPMVMYHSTTQEEDFGQFYPFSHFGTAKAARDRAAGLGVTSKLSKSLRSPGTKADLPGARTYPVYLSIQKPLEVTDQAAANAASLLNWLLEMHRENPAKFADLGIDIGVLSSRGYQGSVEALRLAGYDGLKYTNLIEDRGSVSYVTLDSNQVKSVMNPDKWTDDPAILKQARAARQATTTPGSPGLGTPAGRNGEPRTTINFARFSTEQEANETVKATLESYLDDVASEDPLDLAEQIRQSQPALDELNAALGMQDFGRLDSFVTESNEKAGVIRDVSHRIMAARQVMADAGSFAARIAKRHSTASQEEMYDFLRAMQIVKRYGYEVKVQMREIARALGAQRAVYVPDPDFKIPPALPKDAAQVPPQGAVPPPTQAVPPTTPAQGATMPQAASGAPAPTPGPSGAPGPVTGATAPAGATATGAAPVATGAAPAISPEVAAKARAQFITDAGGEQAVRARMRKVAMAEASGNPLAVTKLSRMDRFGNVLTEYFMNSILSGPATHVVNVLGNTLVSSYLPLEKALGATIRGIAGGRGAAESLRMAGEHLKPYRHMYHAFTDSWSFAKAALKADRNILENVGTVEFKPRAISASNLGMAEGTLAAQAVNWLGTALNIPTRVLSSTDEFFKQINYRAALMTELEMEGMQRFSGDAMQAAKWAQETADRMITEGQAYSEKVVMQKAMMEADRAVTAGSIQPDERSAFIARFMADSNNWDEDLGVLSDRAMDYSRYATFTTPLTVGEGGRISRVSARIQQLAEESTIVRFIMPFVRTPTRILEFALDRTIPGQAANLRNAFGQLKGQMTHAQRSVRDEAMGRVAFAVMTTYGLFHLIHAGNITGDGPSNPTERDAWLQAGNQPYSIKFGDKWISYRRLDPFASMMGLVVDTVESYSTASERQRPQMQSVVNAIIVGLANNFTNKSYLTGVASLLEAIKDPERYGDKLVYQYVSATVPYSSAMRQAKSGFADDLVVRDVRSMLDAVRNTIPGAATAVMPRRNMFGEPVERAQGWGPDIFSPITYTTVKDDLIMKELDLIGHSFDSPREVRNGMDLSSIVGKSGQTAYDRWLELHGTVKIGGQTLRQAMIKTIRSRPYQTMSPETTDMYESPRVRALRTIVEKYRAAAYKKLMQEFPEVNQGVNRDFATKRALKTGRPVQELMSLANR